jgi:SAM-dependent methyltransferase
VTWAWVDRDPDPEGLADWQEQVARWPAVDWSKARSAELLAGCGRVLDIGCGPGADLVRYPTVVGIDRSRVMLHRAAERAPHALLAGGDAERLPFRDGAFDGVRADRVLQHVEDPDAFLGEVLRVLAPGGVLTVTDPDQGSLVIEVPGAPAELVERVRERRKDVHCRQGTVIRSVPARLRALGVADLHVDVGVIALTDPDEAYGLPTWVLDAQERGVEWADGAAVAAWDAAMEQARAGSGFLYLLMLLVVSARRPG